MGHATNIDLYTAGTPNGQKINIILEELQLKYNVHKIDISKNVQKEEWFLKINPNGRIPAIVDHTSGSSKRVFEGASIMLYLCEKYDKSHSVSFAYDSDEHWECLEWLVWMQSGIGPMQGQANHFYRYAPEKIEYGINRYQAETKRLYQVLEDRLVDQEKQRGSLWIVGGKYSIADLACFSWINWAEWAGIDTKPYQKIQAWMREINKRPAVQVGLDVPEKFEMKEKMKSKEGEAEYAKFHGSWVMKGQEADQEKFKD